MRATRPCRIERWHRCLAQIVVLVSAVNRPKTVFSASYCERMSSGQYPFNATNLSQIRFGKLSLPASRSPPVPSGLLFILLPLSHVGVKARAHHYGDRDGGYLSGE